MDRKASLSNVIVFSISSPSDWNKFYPEKFEIPLMIPSPFDGGGGEILGKVSVNVRRKLSDSSM